jgi:hypothetical protein
MAGKFELGKIILKDEAVYALTLAGQDAGFFLLKHASGDCGEEDHAMNEQGLREGSAVLSRYRTLRGHEIFVVTLLAKQETYLFCPPNTVVKHVVGLYDPGPACFKYDGMPGLMSASGPTPDLVPPVGPILKASPYYYGPSDPCKPKEDKP